MTTASPNIHSATNSARWWTQHPYLVCPVDDHGRGHGTQVCAHRRSTLLRRPTGGHLAHRCAGLSPWRWSPPQSLLQEHGLAEDPLLYRPKARHPVPASHKFDGSDERWNGRPIRDCIATAAGKAAFWDFVGAPHSLKVLALEGEFPHDRGHAQELKTQALALQVANVCAFSCLTITPGLMTHSWVGNCLEV